MKTTDELIKESGALLQWFDSKIGGQKIPAERKSRLASACLDVAHEHHRAIVLLFANGIFGSGFALLRPMYESYVRGVWLHRCAGPKDIKLYEKDRLDRSFDSLIQDIEKHPEFDNHILSIIKRNTWKSLNSLTHTGFQQAVRRYRPESIGANYDNQEVVNAVKMTNVFSFMVALAIADLCDNKELLQAIVEKQRSLFPGKL